MEALSSLPSASARITASLLNSAEQNPAVAAKLLKKAIDSDKDLVNTLLPLNGAGQGGVDIRA